MRAGSNRNQKILAVIMKVVLLLVAMMTRIWTASILTLIMVITLAPKIAVANVRVAFLEVYNSQGKLVQYAPGSRFGHSAIQINPRGGLWLQAYPGEGVKFITEQELATRGKIAAVLEIPVDVSPAQVTPFVGKPFDFNYSWSNEAFYCSELLAKILQIPTEPMRFNHEVWPKSYWSKDGQAGLSPDGAYRYLKQKYSL